MMKKDKKWNWIYIKQNDKNKIVLIMMDKY